MEHTVIVGAGQAAVQLIVALRQRGHAGRITLVGDEPDLPYQRPPLSKAWLLGGLDEERLSFKPRAFYDGAGVELRLGIRASAIDRAARRLTLADGSAIGYDRLVLACGSRARPWPGPACENVWTLRSLADARALKGALAQARRVVVIGGGYVGLEVAASACKLGAQVTLIESAPRLLARSTAPGAAAFLADGHRAAGVDLRLGTGVARLEQAAGVAQAVVTDAGESIAADLVVIGIGGEPNDELARAAGLETDGGIVVDAAGRTSDPAIFAAGDCTVGLQPRLGRRLRLESVANAIEQANQVAAALCGEAVPAAAVPWFWSDQHGMRLQTAGLPLGHDATVTRHHDSAEGAPGLVEVYLSQGQPVACTCINRPQDFALARRALADPALAPAFIDRVGGVRQGRFACDGGELWYELAGPAQAGDPVVLLHGFSFDASSWDPQFEHLARQHRTLRYDLRGFGRSSPPAGPYDHVRDLLALLDHLGLGQAHLVGLSLGANIALTAAWQHPGRVRSLVLASAGLAGHAWAEERPPEAVLAHARQHGVAAGRAFWLQHPIFAAALANPLARGPLERLVAAYSGWHWANANPAAPFPDLTARLGELDLPVLVVGGERDARGYQDIAARLRQGLPRAQALGLADTGHMVNLERPDLFNAALDDFLSAQAPT